MLAFPGQTLYFRETDPLLSQNEPLETNKFSLPWSYVDLCEANHRINCLLGGLFGFDDGKLENGRHS